MQSVKGLKSQKSMVSLQKRNSSFALQHQLLPEPPAQQISDSLTPQSYKPISFLEIN